MRPRDRTERVQKKIEKQRGNRTCEKTLGSKLKKRSEGRD